LVDVFLLFPNAALRFTYDLKHTLAVDGDAKRLQRVVDNIIQTAVQAVCPGGRIWFATRDVAAEVELVIGNERSFVPPADRELIFEPYYTRGKPRGTGLGLALARKVVLDHGGRIECRSEYGRGTELVLRLPATKRPKAATDVSLPETAPASASAALSG
jgi:signal transduction histidine kinase